MIKKDITYTDFFDQERTEPFFFNLSKAELSRLQLTAPNGDLTAHLQSLIDATDRKEIVAALENIISMSYGERTEDGRYFMKSPEITQRFLSSAAYSELFVELLSDPDSLAIFVKGLIPTELQGSFEEKMGSVPEVKPSARELSESMFQGYNKPKQNKVSEPAKTIESIPELPTAEPVLEEAPGLDLDSLSQEQLLEMVKNNQKDLLK